MSWHARAQLQFVCRSKGRVLAVMVAVDELLLMALETVEPVADGLESGAKAVFEHHAHRVIGRAADLPTAIVLAERFARQWQRGKPLARCTCSGVLP